MAIKGRDTSQNNNDRETTTFKQYENDIFLKHDESPVSSSVTIREETIGLHTKDGNVGVLINANGKVMVQGKVILKVSGSDIVKGDYTENSLSFINMTGIGGFPPHIHDLQAAYLWRWPGVGLIEGIMDMLEQFQKLF